MAPLWSRGSPWRLCILPLLAMLLAVGCHASYGLVLNGGFEKPPVSDGFDTYTPPQNIPDWVVGGAGVDLIHTYWAPAEPNQSLDLNALGPGSVSQNLNTVANQTYKLSFMYSGNPELTRGLKTMQVYWDDLVTPLDTVTFNTTVYGSLTDEEAKANMVWLSKSYLVTASGSSTALSFVSLTPGACGNALDLVSVTPEPSSWALLGLAVGVPFWIRRRKRS